MKTELNYCEICRMLRSKPRIRDSCQKFSKVSALLKSPSVELTTGDFGHMLSSQPHVCGSCYKFSKVSALLNSPRTLSVELITGWQRPIGCRKFQVIFRKRATNCRALLQNMTCRDKASYGSSSPCIER